LERTKSLVLIRAKHLAESVTTPMLLVDDEGTLVFYNEAAEATLGLPFADLGPVPVSDWQERFRVRSRDDAPFPLDAMPGWIELQKERPGTGHVRFTTAAGHDVFIAVCAFPLFTSERRFDGALVFFWEEPDT
jgi:PAS domain-containing protein